LFSKEYKRNYRCFSKYVNIEFFLVSKETKKCETMLSMDNFGDWLLKELKKRELSQSDLSKISGLSRGTLSNLINGTRGIGPDSLLAIAKALKLPPAQVFEAAGILPTKGDTDPWVEKMSHILEMLNPQNREMAERLIETMVEQEQAKNQNKNSQKISEAKKLTNGKSA
jgi:transcriptional regulator with XRE-family HTH domain